MRPSFYRTTGLVGVVFLVLLLLGNGCSGMHHVSAKTFIDKVQSNGDPLHSEIFIGATDRAYLEEWWMFPLTGEHTNVLWTDIDDFPPDIRARLKAGENPWPTPRATQPIPAAKHRASATEPSAVKT